MDKQKFIDDAAIQIQARNITLATAEVFTIAEDLWRERERRRDKKCYYCHKENCTNALCGIPNPIIKGQSYKDLSD